MSDTRKFRRTDVCRVRDDARHPEAGRECLIEYSYSERYGGGNTKDYSVMFTDTGHTLAWMDERHLEFVRHGTEDDFIRLIAAREERHAREADPEWIAAHWTGDESVSGSTAEALMRMIGITNPWGRSGEGFVWAENWDATRFLLAPALATRSAENVKRLADAIRAGDAREYRRLRQEMVQS